MTEEEREDRIRKRAALLLLPILLLGAGCCFWSFFASVAAGEAVSFIAAPLGSQALANYGEDEIPGRLRSLSISIVEAVIRDRDPEEEDVGSRLDEVIDSLKSPVPTVPGGPTGTPTSRPSTTPTLDLVVTATATETGVPSPSPVPSRTPMATETDVPPVGPTSTPVPSKTPSKTPAPSKTPTITLTPPCKVPPYIEIMTPAAGEHFTFADDLPAQAFAFDPDNVDPVACSTATAIFPDDDGEGIPGDPEVEMRIEWWSGSSWVWVHTELEGSDPYCAFTSCTLHDLSSGEWPDSPPNPINTGKHRLKAKVLQDDEGVASGWVWHEFYIDPSVITVEDVTATEGSGLTFTVTLDIEVPSAFTVDVSLTDASATGGSPLVSPKDYDNVVATLNFSGNSGETEQFTVATLDDAVLEGSEAFTVSLNASSSLVTDTDTATGTIDDNDTAAVTVDSASEIEGTGLLFTVTLDNAVQSAFDVNVSLGGGSAMGGAAPLVAPEDYDNVVAALNFAGTAGETQQFTVATLDDSEVEGTETFTVSLNASDILVTDSDTGTGTISDNDIASCPDFDLFSFYDDEGSFVEWDLTNTALSSVTLKRIQLEWGPGNLDKIKLGGATIWSGSPVSSPIDMSGFSESFTASQTEVLRFEFSSSVSGLYKVTVHSDTPCSSGEHIGDAD